LNHDRGNGAVDNEDGGAEQRAGESTGDTQAQAEGIAQQSKGNVENTFSQSPHAWRPSGDVRDVEALLNSFREGPRRIQ
jgi:uncharacterized protein YjbJ (UPF0337 family)